MKLTLEEANKLPKIMDPQDVKGLKEDALFLAEFMNNPPNGDFWWHARQIMPQLMNGQMIRYGLPISYWRDWADKRPPICKKTKGKNYVVAE